MIIDCQIFVNKRKTLNLPVKDNDNLDLFTIIENPDKRTLAKFIAFVKHIIYTYNKFM